MSFESKRQQKAYEDYVKQENSSRYRPWFSKKWLIFISLVIVAAWLLPKLL